jgi:hypothetical protein
LSGLVHVFALAADDWAWSGAVSFRKPLSFAVSIGLLLASVGWVLDRLPERPRLPGALAWTFLISSTIEVGLITMQAWRGRASHFNTVEASDAMIFGLMGATVAVMSLCLVAVFIWSMIERPSGPLARIAVISGLALVITGLGIGQWIIELGNDFVAANNLVPDAVTYGEAGVAKFPHAVAFHGIQAFIVASVMLGQTVYGTATRKRLLWMIVTGYTALLVFASMQTIVGRSPLDPSIWSLGFTASLALLVAVFSRVLRGLAMAAVDHRKTPLPVS